MGTVVVVLVVADRAGRRSARRRALVRVAPAGPRHDRRPGGRARRAGTVLLVALPAAERRCPGRGACGRSLLAPAGAGLAGLPVAGAAALPAAGAAGRARSYGPCCDGCLERRARRRTARTGRGPTPSPRPVRVTAPGGAAAVAAGRHAGQPGQPSGSPGQPNRQRRPRSRRTGGPRHRRRPTLPAALRLPGRRPAAPRPRPPGPSGTGRTACCAGPGSSGSPCRWPSCRARAHGFRIAVVSDIHLGPGPRPRAHPAGRRHDQLAPSPT